MTPNLEQILIKTFPNLYSNLDGFYCGDGWYNILFALSQQIQAHQDWIQEARRYRVQHNIPLTETPHPVTVQQVKEKWGTMRFYYHGGDDWIQGMVMMAEALSTTTCEVCGAPGVLQGDHWCYVSCELHTQSEDKR
jgi:hypothetical protein